MDIQISNPVHSEDEFRKEMKESKKKAVFFIINGYAAA